MNWNHDATGENHLGRETDGMSGQELKRVCVYCGSKVGANGLYQETAARLGRLLAERGLGLVYGGGRVGQMGVLADAALDAGGEVIGVIPEMLAVREVAHQTATMEVVDSMHKRKARMVELADAFVALPGGYGTFEELMETVTWAQLGIHRKPVGLLNVAGYFDALAALIDHAVAEEFILPEQRDLLFLADDPESLLDALPEHRLPIVRQWITRDET
ncbi:MAG: TIGR00730 family Rossman fold protein [Planctomycetales bacterium]